jgi:hypothetical protein
MLGGDVADGDRQAVRAEAAEVETVTLRHLVPGTEYCVAIRARDVAGNTSARTHPDVWPARTTTQQSRSTTAPVSEAHPGRGLVQPIR